MLAEAKVELTVIKTIVGHSGAMPLTERGDTHINVQEMLDDINRIYGKSAEVSYYLSADFMYYQLIEHMSYSSNLFIKNCRPTSVKI